MHYVFNCFFLRRGPPNDNISFFGPQLKQFADPWPIRKEKKTIGITNIGSDSIFVLYGLYPFSMTEGVVTCIALLIYHSLFYVVAG